MLPMLFYSQRSWKLASINVGFSYQAYETSLPTPVHMDVHAPVQRYYRYDNETRQQYPNLTE